MNFKEFLIYKFLSRTPESRKKNIDKATIEFFGILTALILIFLIWLYYPSFITWMDQPARNNIIPFKLSEIKNERVDPNNFQKVGENFGTYGDSYGSLNTLFSGFAFAILIISLFMQRQELKEQRKELEAQRLEIKQSNDIAEAQRKITEQQATLIEKQIKDSKIQSFYQTLFKYLDEKNRKIESLDNLTITSFNLFESFLSSFHEELAGYGDSSYFDSMSDQNFDSLVSESFTIAYENTDSNLKNLNFDKYMNFIFNFIKNHKDLGIENDAINIVISFLSLNEIIYLSYLGIYDIDLHENIEHYSLLRQFNNLDIVNNYFITIIRKKYSEKSFILTR